MLVSCRDYVGIMSHFCRESEIWYQISPYQDMACSQNPRGVFFCRKKAPAGAPKKAKSLQNQRQFQGLVFGGKQKAPAGVPKIAKSLSYWIIDYRPLITSSFYEIIDYRPSITSSFCGTIDYRPPIMSSFYGTNGPGHFQRHIQPFGQFSGAKLI